MLFCLTKLWVVASHYLLGNSLYSYLCCPNGYEVQALLIPFFAERQSDGFNFELHFDKPIIHSKPEKMTQQLNDLLNRIRTKMDQWLWTHKRWKKLKIEQF